MINKYLNSRERKIFLFTLIVVLTASIVNGVIMPLSNKASELDEQIAIKRQQLEGHLKVIERSETMDSRFKRYLERFQTAATKEEAATSMLSEIALVAGKLGLIMMDLKPIKGRSASESDHFSVSLTLSHELVDIVHFLYTLQQPPYLFDVEEITIKQGMRRGDEKIRAQLTLSKDFMLSNPL